MRILIQRKSKSFPAPPRAWHFRLILLLLRLLLVFGAAFLAVLIPLPSLDELFPLKNVLISLAAVIAAGKLLYDTLFFDHFQP